MPTRLRNERVEDWLTLLAVLTGASSLLLLIVAPIVRDKPLSDTAIVTAVYVMIGSAAVCLAVNVPAVADLLRAILRTVKR